MQPKQVKEEFPRIGRIIDQATDLCQMTNDVPDDLRECLSALDQESDHAKDSLMEEQNDNRIVQTVERLEKLSDRAMQTCRQAGNTVDEQMQDAVRQVHDALSELKHRLH